MKFTLNIYKGREVAKTYEADSYDLMYGTLEDFVNVLDGDIFAEDVSKTDFVASIMDMVKNSMSMIKPLLMEVFEGLTEDEIRRTKVKELANVIFAIAKYSFAEIGSISDESKNA